MHENRETSKASADQTDRSAKAQSRKADVYAMQESDCCVEPVNQPNKEGKPLAEAVEGRRQPKDNGAQTDVQRTQRGERVSQGLSGVRRVARERKQEQFTALPHHVTVNLLRESFEALKKNAAPGCVWQLNLAHFGGLFWPTLFVDGYRTERNHRTPDLACQRPEAASGEDLQSRQ
jgi:RNA-directed DNA polymerase